MYNGRLINALVLMDVADYKRHRRLALACSGVANGAWSMARQSFLRTMFAEPKVIGQHARLRLLMS